ncbi:MAG: FGGY-family carbohydrate kinase, partial [Bacteroidales bacterium]
DSGISIGSLKVDGGASKNDLMMQFQADVLGTKVIRPKVTETTAMGAAYLAGLACGYWDSLNEIKKEWQAEAEFIPSVSQDKLRNLKAGWADAIARTLSK